ncbi:MAG: hypothetical protein K0B09_10220 [Bacteroidales bacterium]|nr:hypothetical protein [Bacteroidales bacterium]
MNKKTIIKLGFLIAIIGGLLYWFLATRQTQNEVIVTVDNSLSSDKVHIEFGFYSINSGSDQNLSKIGFDKVIFSGHPKGDFETICGENDFFVTYDNEYYTILRHFIPNDFYDGIPKPHKYNFDFKKYNGKIHLKLNIVGPDGEIIEKELVKVSDANDNIWGRQINKTK